MNDQAEGAGSNIRGGGGIVFGDVDRSRASTGESPTSVMNAIRRRWASGVAILTVVDGGGGFRGVTATSFVVISLDPPIVAVALSSEGSFHKLFEDGTAFGVSLLDRSHTFVADRFAGRAPVPDPVFSGVPHTMLDGYGVPIIEDAIGWCACRVSTQIPVGDHILLLAGLVHGGTNADTDDPLLSYEGRYRSLEVG